MFLLTCYYANVSINTLMSHRSCFLQNNQVCKTSWALSCGLTNLPVIYGMFSFPMCEMLFNIWLDVKLCHIKHLTWPYFVFAPARTWWRLDEWNSAPCWATPRHIIAVWKRTGGTCKECRNWTWVRQGKQAWDKEVHSCLCAAIKEGFC